MMHSRVTLSKLTQHNLFSRSSIFIVNLEWLGRDYYGLETRVTSSCFGGYARENTFLDGRSVNYDSQIQVLVDWLSTLGWRVVWYNGRDSNDEASLDDMQVSIGLKQCSRHQYYSLLHECGHVDLLAGPKETRRGEPHGYLDLWWGQCNPRTLRHRVAVVIDEIAAWQRGEELASRLGLGIDEDRYRDFRNRNLKSYFAWCVDPDDDFEACP